MADTPHGITHPIHRQRSEKKPLKKSIYFGILLFLLREKPDRFSREQQLWIVNYARKLSDEEVFRAGRLTELLITEESKRIFHLRDISNVLSSVPWIEPFNAPEAVRIGKGYTDKGALRPLHKKGRENGETSVWDEDVFYLLPSSYETRGKWLTADEVQSLVGVDLLNLALSQIRSMTTNSFLPYRAADQANLD
jgi:hypothetical protein